VAGFAIIAFDWAFDAGASQTALQLKQTNPHRA
jgi:hypothetical protein